MSWIPRIVAAWEKVSSSSKILTWIYSRPYKRVIENEIRLAGINSNDTVLNIGCGAVPFTALYLALLTGCRVYALDLDPVAAGHALKCVRKAGLEDRITVLHADGCIEFEPHFTVSVVALQAAPKAKILNALNKTSSPGSRFIFRMPSLPYKNHYDCLSTGHLPMAEAFQPMRTFDRSVLYQKAV